MTKTILSGEKKNTSLIIRGYNESRKIINSDKNIIKKIYVYLK